MFGGGPFGLKAGQWTDDTSMALCLAQSLVMKNGFNAKHQMKLYCRWWRKGYLSSTGTCFDIGNTVKESLQRYLLTGNPFAGDTDPYKSGNGSLMRLAPVPMFFFHRPWPLIERMCADSSRTTHGAQIAVDACRFYGGLIIGALQGESKETLLADSYAPEAGYWEKHPLCREIDVIARGSYKHKNPPEIRGTGYAAHCLEASLWAFYHSRDFKEGCLAAVNLGNDADTTGAVFGQLAGTYFGKKGIPVEWLQKLTHLDMMKDLAETLLKQGNL